MKEVVCEANEMEMVPKKNIVEVLRKAATMAYQRPGDFKTLGYMECLADLEIISSGKKGGES